MSEQESKNEMMMEMISDLDLGELAYVGVDRLPSWLYEMANNLIRRGWRKSSES